MKKTFDLTDDRLVSWRLLVMTALKHASSIQFNILFLDSELNEVLNKLKEYVVIKSNVGNKFFQTNKVLELTVNKEVIDYFDKLDEFRYWQNKFIEDPSFWAMGCEILACISHENIVMIDTDYFDINLINVDANELFDYTG